MPSPHPFPEDAFHEEAIGLSNLEGPEGPEFDPQFLLIRSAFGLHIRQGKPGDEGLRSENDIADLVRRLLDQRKSVDLHFEF
ncbi:hypothetical protein [Xanthomonas cissicola]|uniref:Uncharacterized protein n=1 Tax=Xanthomonas cissicola TaxID=86186 RepID=A0ABX3LTR6_9XANT|nr:hypothetical protein [Xanthomonas cissicola]KAB0532209.1 hypothetical protein F7R02_17675 [Xanthomonas cissicola]OOW57910.1 hypothetical protein Xant_14910 [Xanthomonas cissicola]